ncbi:MAG TPA: hypothetical protein PKE04_17525, partial [Clostridia bacterium]|nr:hypothetical protein [Clostridia bacterium]
MPAAFRAFFHKIDTRRQYQLLILLTVTCMVGLVVLVSLLFANIILRRNEEYVRRVIDQYRQNLSQQSAKTKEFIEAVAFNPAIIAFLAETDPFERYEYGLQVSAFLDSIQAGRNEVLDLFFLSPKGEGVTFYALSKAQPQIAQALLKRSTPDIIGAYPYLSAAYGTDGSDTPALFAGCAVYDTAHSAAQKVCVGAVGVALDIAEWTGNLSKLMELKGMSYLLLDAQGNPLSGTLLCDDPGLLEGDGLIFGHPRTVAVTVRRS